MANEAKPVMSQQEFVSKVSRKVIELQKVEPGVKSQVLQTAIYGVLKSHPFLGSMLQLLHMEYTYQLPTLGVMFDVNQKVWRLYINPFYLCKCLNAGEQHDGLLHELEHIVYKHPVRAPFSKLADDKRQIMNIAADLVINQRLKNPSKGCPECPPPESGQMCTNSHMSFTDDGEFTGTGVCPGRWILLEDYYTLDSKDNRIPFPEDLTMEAYYELILQKMDDDENKKDKKQGEGDGEGEGEGEGDDQGGSGKGNGIPKTHGSHNWDGAGEERDMLDATEELVKRAMVKQRMGYDKLPGAIKDLLEDIKARKAELNYKAIILSAVKKHASGHDRKHTWTRKSRRFGSKAPGTKVANLPKLDMFLDTSGSISTEELNEFLDIMDHFLKTGSRNCMVNLFHTSNYLRQPYKLGQRFDNAKVQSGGTCLEESMRVIHKVGPDLAVFITDGYYSDVEAEKWMKIGQKFPQCVFIISRQGTEDHPLKRFGTTIKIPNQAK